MAKLSIAINIVPTQGDTVKKTVDIGATGASVEEICRAAGIDITNKDLTVNGKPAQLNTHVGASDVLAAKDRGKEVVAVSERPRGS